MSQVVERDPLGERHTGLRGVALHDLLDADVKQALLARMKWEPEEDGRRQLIRPDREPGVEGLAGHCQEREGLFLVPLAPHDDGRFRRIGEADHVFQVYVDDFGDAEAHEPELSHRPGHGASSRPFP